MSLTKPMSAAGKMSAETPPDRDRAVDVARLAALVVVMFGHCALLLATIDDSGLRIGNLLGELPAIDSITWIVQVMPLFFLAGGAAGAYGWHPGTPWGAWLFKRAQRLCRPVFWYLAAWSVGLLVAQHILGAESAEGLGRECVALLWFLGVYFVALAFVPALTRLRTGRAVAVVVVSLLAAATALDAIRFAVGEPMAGVANFLIVWLIPVAIGVAYARRLIGPRVGQSRWPQRPSPLSWCSRSSGRPRSLSSSRGRSRSPMSPRRPCCSRCTARGCRSRSLPPQVRSGAGPRGPGSGTSSRWATGER